MTDEELLLEACQDRNLGPGSFGLSGDSLVELILAQLRHTEKCLSELEPD